MSIQLKLYTISIVISIIVIISCAITFIIMKPKTEENVTDSEDGDSFTTINTNSDMSRQKTESPSKTDQTKEAEVTTEKPSGGLNPKGFNTECLKAHNSYRKSHSSPDLTIDKTLINYAKSRATRLRKTDVFEHAQGLEYGENLHYISPYSSYPCDKIVKAWYNEIKDYNFDNPSKSKGMVGHFTQVVWKTSLRVGCAQAYSKASKKLYSVCNYDPPGNFVGEDKENVLKPHN